MRARLARLAFSVSAIAALSCGAAAAPTTIAPAGASRTTWLVVAPHPDDEALVAAGTLARAVENGQRVAVVVMTNGDYDCVHDGLAREAESIAGLAAVGVAETQVHFLGYPDGALSRLGAAPLPPARRKIAGTCAAGNTTYALRGAGGADVHTARHRAPAVYTRRAAVEDLAAVLADLRPENVIVTHPADTHPDHAATYGILRDALEIVPVMPRVHRAIVHNGDCWPNGVEPQEPCSETRIDPRAPTPPLSGRLAGYVPRERLPVPESCLVPDPTKNAKLRAIAAHASQTRGTFASYLFGFARSDEVFFPEVFEREGSQLRRTGSRATPAMTTRARVSLRDGEHLAAITLAVADVGTYVLDLDRADAHLSRTIEGSAARLLATWPLPHDAFEGGQPEGVELGLDPRPDDGNLVEITFRFRGGFAGGAVDVSAYPTARRGP